MALFRIWGPDEQFGTYPKKKCPGGRVGALYAKLDPRLICFNMRIVPLNLNLPNNKKRINQVK